MKSSFPVIDYSDRLLCMVTLKRVHETPEDKRQQLTAGEIMIPLEDLVVMLPSRSADEALMKMTRTRIGKVFVCDPQGVLLGLVSKTDIMNMASERQEFQRELKKLLQMILRLCKLFLLNHESANGGRFKLGGKKPTAFKNYMLQLLLESVIC
jgi:predicted transcriptional regulator